MKGYTREELIGFPVSLIFLVTLLCVGVNELYAILLALAPLMVYEVLPQFFCRYGDFCVVPSVLGASQISMRLGKVRYHDDFSWYKENMRKLRELPSGDYIMYTHGAMVSGIKGECRRMNGASCRAKKERRKLLVMPRLLMGKRPMFVDMYVVRIHIS